MRIGLGSFVIAAAALLTFGAPPASANSDSAADAATVKKAGAAVRLILKGFNARMTAVRVTATQSIGALIKAEKTGVDIEILSGVPSTPGETVSAEQRKGLVEAAFVVIVRFYDEALDACHEAYVEYAASPEFDELQGTTSIQRLPGSGGPPDLLTAGMTVVWDKNVAALMKQVVKFRVGLTADGFTFTLTLGPAPTFADPDATAAPAGALRAPVPLATGGDSGAVRRTIVGYSPSTGATESNTGVLYNDFDGTVPANGGVRLRNVGYYKFDQDAPPYPAVGTVYLTDTVASGTGLRPALPVRLTSPGPCVPASTGADLTASLKAVHLGTVPKGMEGDGKSLVLTNHTGNDIAVVITVQASGTSVGKIYAFPLNFTVPANGEFTIFVDGSSPTPGDFNAVLQIGPDLRVAVDIHVTN